LAIQRSASSRARRSTLRKLWIASSSTANMRARTPALQELALGVPHSNETPSISPRREVVASRSRRNLGIWALITFSSGPHRYRHNPTSSVLLALEGLRTILGTRNASHPPAVWVFPWVALRGLIGPA
jgi:hypothetical protein